MHFHTPVFEGSKVARRARVTRHEDQRPDGYAGLQKLLGAYDRTNGICRKMIIEKVKGPERLSDKREFNDGNMGHTTRWLSSTVRGSIAIERSRPYIGILQNASIEYNVVYTSMSHESSYIVGEFLHRVRYAMYNVDHTLLTVMLASSVTSHSNN